MEKVILRFNDYFILSGTQEKNKTTYKLVNGGGNALFFLENTYIKLILFGVMCEYIVCVCMHTHVCDMYVYTHTPLSMTYKIVYQIGNFKILCILFLFFGRIIEDMGILQ